MKRMKKARGPGGILKPMRAKLRVLPVLAALLFLSWASGELAFVDPQHSTSPPKISSASSQGSSVPSILYASVEPEKVRPGDSMLGSNPSGASPVSADAGWIEAVSFIFDAAMYDTGWWTHG